MVVTGSRHMHVNCTHADTHLSVSVMAVFPFVLGLGPKFRVLTILKERHVEQVIRSNQNRPKAGWRACFVMMSA